MRIRALRMDLSLNPYLLIYDTQTANDEPRTTLALRSFNEGGNHKIRITSDSLLLIVFSIS